jgi:hypothetical protein
MEEPYKEFSPACIQKWCGPIRHYLGCFDQGFQYGDSASRQTECLRPTLCCGQTHANSREGSRTGSDREQSHVRQTSHRHAMPHPSFFDCLIHHVEQVDGVAVRRTVIRDPRQTFMVTKDAYASGFACGIKRQNQHRELLYG